MATSSSSGYVPFLLPEDMWIEIFSYLRPIEILRFRLVCKHWALLSTLPGLRKKLCLRLDEEHKPLELRTYLTKSKTNYLPIHSLHLVNLEHDEHLMFILKAFSADLRCLKVRDSKICRILAAVNLTNIEVLEFNFYETSPDFFNELRFIKSYKNLITLRVICPDELNWFGIGVLQRLLESDTIHSLQHLHLSYHFNASDTFLKFLKKYAPTLKELELHFSPQPYPWCPESWLEVLSKLKKLKTLRLSGDSKSNMTAAFFEGIPASAPLRLIELDGITTLTDDILKHISDKWTNSIIHLSIFFNAKITKEGADEVWKLRNNLESLQIGYCRTFGTREILAAVASDTNYSLRQLCANSMDSRSEKDLCKLVQNLPNLEVLDLSNNLQGITNSVLTHIFRYQTRLRKLCLDECRSFSGRGIAGFGVPEWSKQYPITRLRHLEVLSLQNCQGLKENFVNYLVFPGLRILKLNKLRHITINGFRAIVDNCPTLEVLYVAHCDGLNDEALYYICNNLKFLLELNIRNCFGLSADAINYARSCRHIRLVLFTERKNLNTLEQVFKEFLKT